MLLVIKRAEHIHKISLHIEELDTLEIKKKHLQLRLK